MCGIARPIKVAEIGDRENMIERTLNNTQQKYQAN